MKLHLIPIVLAIASCNKSEKEHEGAKERADPPSDAIRSLEKLRSRVALSDDELIRVIERFAKTEEAWQASIEAGLTTEAEISEMYASMPEMMRQLDRMESEMLGQDAMAAVVSLSGLKSYYDGSIEQALPAMRMMISQYYRSIASDPSESESGFMEKVEKMAESDEELAEMLKTQ